MLRTAGFVFIACFALSALALADARKSKPSATVSPASEFDPSSPAPNTTTLAPNTTTLAPNTTTLAPNTTTLAPNTTTLAPNTTTLAPNTTTLAPNTTTLAPNTTTAAPNTTTAAPNTTTAAPNTTTAAPNTTTAAPNTTTAAPNTTTAAPSTTPVSPTTIAPPSPTPPVGNYNLTNSKNEMCLKAQVALQIRLANKTFTVQPKQTHVDGSCGETNIVFYFNFTQGYINFNFTRDVSNNTVFVDAVGFTLNYPLGGGRLTDARYKVSNTSVYLFPTKIGHSYSCKSESLYMGHGLYLDLTKDQLQAFNLTKNDFGSPDACPADQPDYRVAIAVGVTLLVLIVVVVVAYLLSRRKRMEGYQSL